MSIVPAVLFTFGAIMWAGAGNAWLAALYGLVAGLWWTVFIVDVSR
jgi:hypothetical protein